MKTRPSAYSLAIVFCLLAAFQTQGQITIRPPVRELSADGGGGFILTSGTGTWAAKTTANWISIQPRTKGEAEESCIYVVKKNSNSEPRDAQIMVNDLVHTVIQYGISSETKNKDVSAPHDEALVESPDRTMSQAEPVSRPVDKPKADTKIAPPTPLTPTAHHDDDERIASTYSQPSSHEYSPPTKSATTRLPANHSPSKGKFRLGGTFISPSGDLWKSGGGINAQWIIPMKENFSVGISIGAQKVKVNTDVVDDPPVNTSSRYGLTYMGFVDSYEGDATLIPLGASGIYNIPLSQAVLSLEAGIKYVFVTGDVTANMLDGVFDPYGNVLDADRWREDVDIKGNLLGTVGAQITFSLNESLELYVGGGYQFDIVKSDIKITGSRWSDYDGLKIGENELAGAFGEAGLVFKY